MDHRLITFVAENWGEYGDELIVEWDIREENWRRFWVTGPGWLQPVEFNFPAED